MTSRTRVGGFFARILSLLLVVAFVVPAAAQAIVVTGTRPSTQNLIDRKKPRVTAGTLVNASRLGSRSVARSFPSLSAS